MFCMFFAYTIPRYQVRIYRTISPLVKISFTTYEHARRLGHVNWNNFKHIYLNLLSVW